MPEGHRRTESGVGADDLVPGRYRLTSLLGRGGMGEVYLAQDLLLGRDVAIKLLSEASFQDAAARRRLLKEARATASLQHPFICPVYDCGDTADGRTYIVMQYVEGETLATLLERGAVSPRQALTISAQLAEALGAAHSHGLVHRDVKPANVIITPDGSPRLLDLGIARQTEMPGAASEAPTLSTATALGTIVGTPAYMAPEQVEQRPVDSRTDLFSLGAVLYELLTGRRAFGGTTALETLLSVLKDHPPAPSTLRRELTDRHDALCQRLLAKDPSERFQSAHEVVGAIRLLLDETSGISHSALQPPRSGWRWRSPTTLVIVGLLIVMVVAAWLWNRSALPTVPGEAQGWYDRGTEAIREGAYITGQTALEQAIKLYPQHALAYARLAEADAELGAERSAQQRLVRVASLVSDESRLPEIERLRLSAVRSLVLRDVDRAVSVYREIVARHPDEPGAWLDLGRAQETAGLRSDAKASYEQAVAHDSQYAAAYVRLGYVQGLESNRAAALAAFGRAEQLYRAASDSEGETEVLIRRGSILDAFGELAPARADLERALRLATDARRTYQQVRARAALASVTASEGNLAEAERLGTGAVDDALANGLESVAADTLVDLAGMLQAEKPTDAAAHLERAIQTADRAGAPRVTARARLQQAALSEAQGDPRAALSRVEKVLGFLRENRYRRYEFAALSIASRAHQRLGETELARSLSEQVLAVAETLKDEAQEALALSNLSSITTDLGDYAAALRYRDRAIGIRRRQGNRATLPWDLANRADLLIRMGRSTEAAAVLDELDAGIASGQQAYVGRARRVAYLRGLSAATLLDCDHALPHLRRVEALGPSTENAAVLAPAVVEFCEARRGGRQAGATNAGKTDDSIVAAEVQFWRGAAALGRRDLRAALSTSSDGLAGLGKAHNDELRWRLAAVAAAAQLQLKDGRAHAEMADAARGALARLQSAWKDDSVSYLQRRDLVVLRKQAGLD
jgi:tetratricopeptide (TPR) repeat protein